MYATIIFEDLNSDTLQDFLASTWNKSKVVPSHLIWSYSLLSNSQNVLDTVYMDGFVQERCNSIALAMELRLYCINSLRPSDAYMCQ